MTGRDRSSATIVITGDDLDPDHITELMGVEPTRCWRKGEWRTISNGNQLPCRTGHWALSADRISPADLNGQIENLMTSVTQNLDIWRSLAGQYSLQIVCGFEMTTWNEGFRLSPNVLTLAAKRGALIDVDIFAYLNDEHGPSD